MNHWQSQYQSTLSVYFWLHGSSLSPWIQTELTDKVGAHRLCQSVQFAGTWIWFFIEIVTLSPIYCNNGYTVQLCHPFHNRKHLQSQTHPKLSPIHYCLTLLGHISILILIKSLVNGCEDLLLAHATETDGPVFLVALWSSLWSFPGLWDQTFKF